MIDPAHDQAFRETIQTSRDDDPVWGIYADFLEEHGEPLAGFVRHQANMRELDPEHPARRFLMRHGPPGRFTMGSPAEDDMDYGDEPLVQVELTSGAWLGAFPVTQAEYAEITGRNPSHFAPTGDGADRVEGLSTDRFPVERVSWEEALAFCTTLTGREREAGRLPPDWAYALPTEAQWEYACRAGSASRFVFGDEEEVLDRHAWFDRNSDRRTHEVGLLPANRWGFRDMLGNVFEWCRDGYARSPVGGRDPCAPTNVSHRVIRGGSWGDDARCCRASYRFSILPRLRAISVGIRLALVREGAEPTGTRPDA